MTSQDGGDRPHQHDALNRLRHNTTRATEHGVELVKHAARANGALESGLTALLRATVANFATDAAIAVALANTLFFASPATQSRVNVALYLLMTVAPFAVIAPVIGPLLDRVQRGRRVALAATFALRVVVIVLLIFNLDGWALYPLALTTMVLSKSFSVLKSAITPRVLPPGIDLVRTNSRLTVFGLVGGSIIAGGIAAGVALLFHSTGALVVAALLAGAGAVLSLRIPSWVEVTEGEVPATLGHSREQGSDHHSVLPARQPLGRTVIAGLWANGAIRVLTGFLTFYVAFVAKSSGESALRQAVMLAAAGAAAGIGNFTGNFVGARTELGKPRTVIVACALSCVAIAVAAALLDNLVGAVLAALVASASTALAKVSLDATIQDALPPESIASGFGRSETVLQLAWVTGGALGVLLPTQYWKGFTVVAVLMAIACIGSAVTYRGHSPLPTRHREPKAAGPQ
ncbi:MFS transporter [Nocardia sp. NPDC056000]|uniref:MFS transporter n=1 Tax=Nocardia sp. NPDC056000 TaxID=3345674 RepID=UPI0035D6B565